MDAGVTSQYSAVASAAGVSRIVGSPVGTCETPPRSAPAINAAPSGTRRHAPAAAAAASNAGVGVGAAAAGIARSSSGSSAGAASVSGGGVGAVASVGTSASSASGSSRHSTATATSRATGGGASTAAASSAPSVRGEAKAPVFHIKQPSIITTYPDALPVTPDGRRVAGVGSGANGSNSLRERDVPARAAPAVEKPGKFLGLFSWGGADKKKAGPAIGTGVAVAGQSASSTAAVARSLPMSPPPHGESLCLGVVVHQQCR
jgi:hypothetical protein